MAGRGTDIMLGGNSEYLAKQEMRKNGMSEELISSATAFNETEDTEILNARETYKELVKKYDETIKEEKEQVISAGGLKILGTERHESRRIDNQLRGRSGRQGDPGETRFYIGLDDDLMKIFGGDMVTRVYNTLGADENLPLEMKILTNAVESAQKKVEGRNFSIRKNVLQYDDVMNAQRTIIYNQRKQVLDGEDMKNSISNMIDAVVEMIIDTHTSGLENIKHLNKEAILADIRTRLNIGNADALNDTVVDIDKLRTELSQKAHTIYEEKEQEIGTQELRELERVVMLKVVDNKWMDHIDNMEELKNGIGLRAYGQKDPVVQYRMEGFDMFDQMVADIKLDVVKILLHIQRKEKAQRQQTVTITSEGFENTGAQDTVAPRQTSVVRDPVVNNGPKVGRNEPCICRLRQEV